MGTFTLDLMDALISPYSKPTIKELASGKVYLPVVDCMLLPLLMPTRDLHCRVSSGEMRVDVCLCVVCVRESLPSHQVVERKVGRNFIVVCL